MSSSNTLSILTARFSKVCESLIRFYIPSCLFPSPSMSYDRNLVPTKKDTSPARLALLSSVLFDAHGFAFPFPLKSL